MAQEKDTAAKVVELLLIFAIVLGAALLVMRELCERAENSQRRVTVDRMIAIEDGLAKYLVDSGGLLPTAEQGLAALLKPPKAGPQPMSWNGPYVDDEATLRDAWGRDLQYICPGRPIEGYENIYLPYCLWSYGADGAEGGDEMDRDMCSWDRKTMIP